MKCKNLKYTGRRQGPIIPNKSHECLKNLLHSDIFETMLGKYVLVVKKTAPVLRTPFKMH